MPIRASQARPAYAPPRSSPTRPHDWALDLGLGWRPAPLASTSVLRLRHRSPSPTAQNDLDASSSANLVDPTSLDTGGGSRTRGRLSARLKKVQGALSAGRAGLCSGGTAGASSSSPPPPLGPPPRPSLARSSSSRRFEDATMSLLVPLARRTVTHKGWTGVSSGAGPGGRPRAVHLGPCTSGLLSLLVQQAPRVWTCALRRAAR